MSAIKLLFKTVIALVLALVLFIVGIIVFVDPNDFKEDIQQVVEKETGRQFEMKSIGLSFYPNIGLSLEKAKLSNAQGFSTEPFAAIDEIQIGAKLLPLFSQELVIDTLTLNGLALSLEKNAQGVTNWDDLVKNQQTDEPATTETPNPKETTNNPFETLKSLNFGGMNIQNGTIAWNDESTQQSVQISDFGLSSGQIEFGKPFDFTLSAKTRLKTPQLETDLKLSGQAQINDNGLIALENLTLENQINSAELPTKSVQTMLSSPKIEINTQTQTIQIAQTTLQNRGQGNAEFPLESFDHSAALNGLMIDLANQQYSLQKMTLEAKLNAPDFGLTEADKLSLSTDFTADLNQQTASLKSLTIDALNTQTRIDIAIQSLLDNPIVKANAETQNFNLRTLLQKFKITLPEMQSATALTGVAQKLSIALDSKTQTLKIDALKLNIDDSELSGSASVQNFTTPAVKFDLSLNQVNLNHYLPPKPQNTTETPPATPPASENADTPIELPTEMLRQLNVNGRLKVADLKYDILNPKNILVELKAKGGKIDVVPARADIFGTKVTLQSTLDVRGETPKYATKVDAPNVPVGEVLMAFTGKDTLTGKGSVNADITTQGNSVKQLMANLNGKADTNLLDGVIKGFNLAQSIRDAKATLSGQKSDASNEPKQTDFSQLIAKVDMLNGVVKSREINALSPYMRIIADGNADLGKEKIDFLVKTKIVATDKGQGGEGLEDLKGLTIPVKLSGNLYDPKISLDLKSLIDAKAKQAIEEKKEEIKEKAKEKIEDQVQDKLKGVFKGFGF